MGDGKFYNLIKFIFGGPVSSTCFSPSSLSIRLSPILHSPCPINYISGGGFSWDRKVRGWLWWKCPPPSGVQFQYCPWRVRLYYGEGSRRVISLLFFPSPPSASLSHGGGGGFSQILTMRMWWGSWRKKHFKAGGPSDDWGPRCFSVTLVHTLPPAIRHNC